MLAKYEQWIEEHVRRPRRGATKLGDGYGECESITNWMVDTFPELTRVRGFYKCAFWGKRTHWWCITGSGDVVDPTRCQFPSMGTGEYEQLNDDQLPTGVCMNCGDYCYDGHNMCSDSCQAAVMHDL